MKKNTYYAILGLMFLSVSCEPIEKRDDLKSVLSESELQLDVYGTTEGGNQIVLSNTTPQVGSYWDYIIDISTRQRDTVLIPFLGKQTIKFSGFCTGGVVSTTRTVNITTIDHPIDKEWTDIAGTDIVGKTWVWDYDEESDVIWGQGEYLFDREPTWWEVSAEEAAESMFPEEFTQEMTFDLNGKANFIKKTAEGDIVEQGTFKFDMSKKRTTESGEVWSIGQLIFTGATVLYGYDGDTEELVYVFDILELTDTHMLLAYSNTEEWYSYFWKFKVKD